MGFLSSIFGGGDKPTPAPLPPVPNNDAAAQAERDAAAAETRRRTLAGGRTSTFATAGLGAGDTSQPNAAAKSLLGQ